MISVLSPVPTCELSLHDKFLYQESHILELENHILEPLLSVRQNQGA